MSLVSLISYDFLPYFLQMCREADWRKNRYDLMDTCNKNIPFHKNSNKHTIHYTGMNFFLWISFIWKSFDYLRLIALTSVLNHFNGKKGLKEICINQYDNQSTKSIFPNSRWYKEYLKEWMRKVMWYANSKMTWRMRWNGVRECLREREIVREKERGDKRTWIDYKCPTFTFHQSITK